MIPFGLGIGATWLWLILVPVSGWLVLKSRFFRPYIWRISGYDRYFLIVSTGIAMMLAGIISGYGISTLAVDVYSVWTDIWFFPTEREATNASALITLALVWSAPLSLVYAAAVFGASLFWGEERIKKERADFLAEKNGMLDFIARATKGFSLVMLTLSNRKIYIGWPKNISDRDNPNPSKQYLFFSPLMSGFRTKDSLEMEITGDYSTLGEYFEEGDERYEMSVPVHEIVNAQPFDVDVYDRQIAMLAESNPVGE